MRCCVCGEDVSDQRYAFRDSMSGAVFCDSHGDRQTLVKSWDTASCPGCGFVYSKSQSYFLVATEGKCPECSSSLTG